MSSIRILDADLRSQIRSGVCCVTIAQCVEELCLNSLQSECTCIAVRFNSCFSRIQVADNGVGVAKSDLPLMAERYATSKLDGSRGEFLASVKDVSGVLEITSRSKTDEATYHKAYFRGKPTQISQSSEPRPSSGTTVTVHDFMYNLPVRRQSLHPVIEMSNVRKVLVALALTRPDVSISLRDDSTTDKATMLLKIPTAPNSSVTFSRLFNVEPEAIKPVTVSQGPYQLDGFFANTLPTNIFEPLQFLSVNGRPVRRTRLNKALCALNGPRKSTNDESAEELRRRIPVKGSPGSKSAYVFNMKCPSGDVRLFQEPERSFLEFSDWDLVMGLIDKLVTEVKGCPRSSQHEVAGPAQDTKFDVGDFQRCLNSLPARRLKSNEGPDKPFPPRIHSSALEAFKSKYCRVPSTSTSSPPKPKPHRKVKSCSSVNPGSPPSKVSEPSSSKDENLPVNFVTRSDPVTRATVYVDTVSGNSFFEIPKLPIEPSQVPAEDTGPPVKLTRLPWKSLPAEMKAGDVTKLYRTWDNPCFKVEKPSDMAESVEPDTRPSLVILRSDLDHVTIVGQVEQKFITALIRNGEDRKFLVAFDQHAAHERVRLEELLESCIDKDRGGPLVSALYPPVSITVNDDLNCIAIAFNDHLKRWGVRSSPDIGSGTIRVHGLPAFLVERATSESSRGRGSSSEVTIEYSQALLKELLETIKSTGTSGSIMPNCLLDILKSQACHGAIKFGDPLTVTECESLVNKLKMCKLPFQCAHGRPTVIPLLDFKHLNTTKGLHVEDPPRTWRLSQLMRSSSSDPQAV